MNDQCIPHHHARLCLFLFFSLIFMDRRAIGSQQAPIKPRFHTITARSSNAQFTPTARQDKTVLSVAYQAV